MSGRERDIKRASMALLVVPRGNKHRIWPFLTRKGPIGPFGPILHSQGRIKHRIGPFWSILAILARMAIMAQYGPIRCLFPLGQQQVPELPKTAVLASFGPKLAHSMLILPLAVHRILREMHCVH